MVKPFILYDGEWREQLEIIWSAVLSSAPHLHVVVKAPRKHRVIGRILFQYSTVSVVSVSEKDKQTLLDQYSFRIVFLYKLVGYSMYYIGPI